MINEWYDKKRKVKNNRGDRGASVIKSGYPNIIVKYIIMRSETYY